MLTAAIKYDFSSLESELNSFYSMSDAEACGWYGVDKKADALKGILNYWNRENI